MENIKCKFETRLIVMQESVCYWTTVVGSYEEDKMLDDVSDDFFPFDKDATCRVSSRTFV